MSSSLRRLPVTPRVILVALNWTRDKDPRIPLGHASLLAALQEAGVAAASLCFHVNTPGFSPEAVTAAVRSLAGPGTAVAFGAYVWGEAALQRILPLLRADGFQGEIILGGPQISYAEPGVDVLYPDGDVFIRGYAEQALVAHLGGDEAVEGVHRRGQVDRGQQVEVELDALPSPWLTGAVPLEGQRFVRMETQRGCPFRCTFCQHREAGARLKRWDLDNVRVSEELALFQRSGVREIAVLDPVFNASSQAVSALRHLQGLGYTGELSLQCRFEMLSEAFLDACEELNVRLEFGLQTTHEAEWRAIQRRNRMAKVEAAMAALRARGLRYEVSLIFGLPEQTLASFRESVAFCLERRVPVIRAFPLMLLRGTPLARDAARWGLVESGGAMPCVVASDRFSKSEWLQMARISEALKDTEGAHPLALTMLERFTAAPQLQRWSPQVAS